MVKGSKKENGKTETFKFRLTKELKEQMYNQAERKELPVGVYLESLIIEDGKKEE